MARLDTQVVRFRTAAETAERSEEELKTERRKLQREVRGLLMNWEKASWLNPSKAILEWPLC